jgi:hypothetical protein
MAVSVRLLLLVGRSRIGLKPTPASGDNRAKPHRGPVSDVTGRSAATRLPQAASTGAFIAVEIHAEVGFGAGTSPCTVEAPFR